MTANYTQFLNKLPNVTNQQLWNRLMTQLPPWFGNQQFSSVPQSGSVLNTVLWAYNTTSLGIYNGAVFDFYGNYAQYQYILDQMRFGPDVNILMSDVEQLNLFAQDFFGNTLPRNPGENNVSYKNRIYANIFAPKATRFGMDLALYNLTGFHPIIFEPWNPGDAMFYGDPNIGSFQGQCAYGVGKYGSGEPYQAYIDVLIPNNQGMGNYPGFDLPGSPMPPYDNNSLGGYGSTTITNTGTAVYGSDSLVNVIVSIEDVAQTILNTQVFGTQIWFNWMYVNPIS